MRSRFLPKHVRGDYGGKILVLRIGDMPPVTNTHLQVDKSINLIKYILWVLGANLVLIPRIVNHDLIVVWKQIGCV